MKRIAFILAIILIITLCSCTVSPPDSAAEELVLYSWKLKSENDDNNKNGNGTLNFENGNIILNVNKPDKSELKLNEHYEIDNEKIIIVSEDYGNLTFKYRLYGNELEFSYNDYILRFIKCEMK